jgi:hypothetical protein
MFRRTRRSRVGRGLAWPVEGRVVRGQQRLDVGDRSCERFGHRNLECGLDDSLRVSGRGRAGRGYWHVAPEQTA